MESSTNKHDLSALQGLKTAIYNEETDRIEEFLQQNNYTSIELNQLGDIADMLTKYDIGDYFREKAKEADSKSF